MNTSILPEVTGFPPRRPPLVIEGPPASGAVENPAA
jgi:hypothetical protein